MFLSGYFCKYLRDDVPFKTLFTTASDVRVYHRKVPQTKAKPYVAVLTADQYDPGNLCSGSLTHKQEGFTILVVGNDFKTLQVPHRELERLILACRSLRVTSTELGGSCFIQCIVPQEPQFAEGLIIEGNEMGDPCLVYPVLGSFTLPKIPP